MIVCVRCHGYVELTIYKKNKEIHEGTLNCKNCEIVYPILYGIPIMWGDPIQYFSNRQKLGGELLSSVQSPQLDRKSTRLNSSHSQQSRMPSSA